MRTDPSKKIIAACVWIGAIGCGGGETPPSTEGTSGGEEAITCSVPGSPAMEDYTAAVRLARSGDAAGALTAFERACEAGNACACTGAGDVLVTEGPTRDVARAIPLLERGCQGADPWGCYELGAALFQNRPDEIEHAAEVYRVACDDDVADACLELGRFRMSGIAGEADPAEAVRIYENACEHGSRFACYFLGQAAAAGLGMDAPQPERSVELLSWGCEQASLPHACTALAALDAERRDALLRAGCEGGDPVACDAIAPAAAPSDGTAAQALALPAADAQARVIGTNEQSSSSMQMGGDVALATLGLPPTCVGFVSRRPTETIQLPTGVDSLDISAISGGDSVIAVRDGAGRWTCGDDQPGGVYHARVTLTNPPAGVLTIWGGALVPGERSGGIDYQAAGVEPLNAAYATPAGPQAVTIPASVRARFYQLRLMNATGVSGTVRLDGHDLWPFGPDGGQIVSSEGVQCALAAGAHTLEINVTSRTRTAHGDQGGALVDVELHGHAAAGGEITEASRLFRIQWSPPESPQTRTTTFRLSRAQAADRAQCAAAVAPAGG